MIATVEFTPLDLKIQTAEYRQKLFNNTKEFIRKEFDKDITSLEAEGLIALAKERGLNELAEEMSIDLHIETLEV